MYNDVDMVWLADPFPYLQGNHDVYFTDDMAAVSISSLPLKFQLLTAKTLSDKNITIYYIIITEIKHQMHTVLIDSSLQ